MKKQKRNNSRFYLAVFIALAIVVSLGQKSSAAPVASFEPGRIMDDVVMANSQSMTAAQIQAFLDSKVPVCDSDGSKGSTPTSRKEYFIKNGWPMPIVCLRNYVENSKSSAQTIYDVSQEFRINPQVLIVLLQKEQGLVTDNWPDPTQYRSATGYGCPDTAVCETKYYGFTNQVRNAANMFRRILDASPSWYTPYIIGNNSIRYNPNPNCGSTTVNIQNRATQALYNYTPYQPNKAALNAGYGTGDGCSAYGNRNFYNYFTDWFGKTTGVGNGSIVKLGVQGSGIFLIENGAKRPFPSAEVFNGHNRKWADVVVISEAEFNLIPTGPTIEPNLSRLNGKFIKNANTPSAGIFLIENGAKRPFPSAEVFNGYSGDWLAIVAISEAEFNLIPTGPTIEPNLSRLNGKFIKNANTPSAGIFLIENGAKRPFPSAEVFNGYSGDWLAIVAISEAEFSLIPTGSSISQ